MNRADKLRVAGTIAAAIWIFGGALFFFVHFTLVFYRDNESAIRGVLERVMGLLGA